MSETSEEVATPQSAAGRSPKFRWKWGLGILIVGIVAELFVWNAFAGDSTYQVMFSMPVVSGTPFFLLLWWLFFSGLAFRQKSFGLGVVGGVCTLFLWQFRFMGFEGDMIPRFRLRSAPTPQERLDEYLAESNSATSPDDAGDNESEPRLEISAEDWPEYRGPNRDGVVTLDLPGVNWTETPTEVWRHPIGAGWSSFAIVGGYAFTQEQRGDREHVVCYDAMTGEQVWEHSDPVQFSEPMGGIGPRATPTVSDSRIYALGATGLLNCLNALTGKKLWSRDILKEAGAKNINWAMSGSPLIADDKVIVIPGGTDSNGVVAYDRLTGDRIWNSGNNSASYTAPVRADLLGVSQLLIFHGEGLSGHAIDDGKELWRLPWTNEPKVNAAIPIAVDDRSLLLASGYTVGSALIRFSLDGDDWSVEKVWESRKFKLKFNAAVRKGSYAYGLDEGILQCIDMRDGTSQWKRGRYKYGQLLLAGDVIVVQAEDGDIAVVSAAPERFEEIHRFPALTGKTWNHPVIWNGHLFVRNAEEAACFRLSE